MKHTWRQSWFDRDHLSNTWQDFASHPRFFNSLTLVPTFYFRAPHRWSTLNRDRRCCSLTVSGMKRALSEITFYRRKDGGKRWKKKHQQNSVAAVMAAARTVIAFPRVSYYPRSTIPFIHGDDASRVIVCVVVYEPVAGPFFFNTGERTIVPPRLLFHFYDEQRSAVTVVEIRLEACPIDLWPWVCVVSTTRRAALREGYTCARPSVSLVQLQVHAGREPGSLPTGAKSASSHTGRERCVYHSLLRHYSRSASLAVRLYSRCEVRPTSATRGRAIPRCILICYSAA